MKKKIKWINCAKFVAICAVLVDHTYGLLYFDKNISWASYFSVPLFIVISGMTSYISDQIRKDEKWDITFWRSSSKIISAYLIAAFLCLIVTTHTFCLKDYCIGVLKFNIQGPFYFVALYLQLMLINRVLFNLIKRTWILKDIFIGGGILLVAIVTTKYTNILDIYGGGGKLFGGTYLFCYYIGMMFVKYSVFSDSMRRGIVFAVIGGIGYFAWWRFVCADQLAIDSQLPFGRGLNPPGISIFIMAIFVLCAVYGLCMLLQRLNLDFIVDNVSCLGEHTLYIFLYHCIFRDILSNRINLENQILKSMICFVVMIIGSMLLEWMMKVVGDILKYYLFNRFSLVRNKE